MGLGTHFFYRCYNPWSASQSARISIQVLLKQGRGRGGISSGKGLVLEHWIPLIYEGDPTPLPALPFEVNFYPSKGGEMIVGI